MTDLLIHQHLFQHWLQYFKIDENYQNIGQEIPIISLHQAETLETTSIQIGSKTFYIDTNNMVYQSKFKDYGNNKEIVGELVGEYRDKKIHLHKK
jgi:hypothetical protein